MKRPADPPAIAGTLRAMNRRHALCCAGAIAAGLFTGLAPRGAQAYTLREGWRNPCRGPLPPELAQHPLVLEAFDGIDPRRLVDMHVHLVGNGDAGSGCTVNPSLYSLWHPVEVVRRKAILNGACVDEAKVASVDRAYVERLRALADGFPSGARWLLFAFDAACDDAGREDPALTTFHVPNAYAAAVAAAHPQRFGWVASVHPYREDALARLEAALAAGAVAVKWLPSAMNIDPRDPRCRPYYDRLAAARVPLVVHCGEERAVPGAGRDDFGNPLLVRAPLALGVKVIVAHAASLGEAADTDRASAPRAAAFDLFARLMGEADARERLFADISGVFQTNRAPRVQRAVIEREDWQPRLLHGSDHPLPGVWPLFSPALLAQQGLLDTAAVEPLRRLREHNPLLFDFVLKRHLRAGGRRLARGVFESAAHFVPTASRAAASRPQ